jgi:hypothetical protein
MTENKKSNESKTELFLESLNGFNIILRDIIEAQIPI